MKRTPRNHNARLYDHEGREIKPPACKNCKRIKNVIVWNGRHRVFFCEYCEFLTRGVSEATLDHVKKYWRKKHKELATLIDKFDSFDSCDIL